MKPRAVDTRATNLSSIPNSQPIAGLAFVGKPVKHQPLKPKTIYNPNVSLMHQDDVNTGSTDLASPLGKGTSMTTYATRIAPFLWDSQGRLTTGGVVLSPGSTTPTFSLNAVDPETLQTLATWLPPDNQTSILCLSSRLQLTSSQADTVMAKGESHMHAASTEEQSPVVAYTSCEQACWMYELARMSI